MGKTRSLVLLWLLLTLSSFFIATSKADCIMLDFVDYVDSVDCQGVEAAIIRDVAATNGVMGTAHFQITEFSYIGSRLRFVLSVSPLVPGVSYVPYDSLNVPPDMEKAEPYGAIVNGIRIKTDYDLMSSDNPQKYQRNGSGIHIFFDAMLPDDMIDPYIMLDIEAIGMDMFEKIDTASIEVPIVNTSEAQWKTIDINRKMEKCYLYSVSIEKTAFDFVLHFTYATDIDSYCFFASVVDADGNLLPAHGETSMTEQNLYRASISTTVLQEMPERLDLIVDGTGEALSLDIIANGIQSR